MFTIQRNRLLCILLVFAIMLSLFSVITPMSTSAAVNDEFTIDGLTYKITDESNVSVTKFDNSKKIVVIPNEVSYLATDYIVNTIDKSAFNSCNILQEISFPNSLISIGNTAFSNCTALETIRIHSNIDSLGKIIFLGCQVKNFYFETSNITSDFLSNFLNLAGGTSRKGEIMLYGYKGSIVESYATQNGYNFVEIVEAVDTTLLNNVLNEAKAIDKDYYTAASYAVLADAIEKAEKILENNSPASSEIENCVSELRNAITNLELDYVGGVIWQKIDDGKAIEITGVKEKIGGTLTIPSEIKGLPVTSIGENAISNVNYNEVIIPDSVTIIKKRAFYGSSNTQKITFSENSSITTIENEAFAVAANVTWDTMSEISLPISVKSIGDKAFAQRKNLTGVTVYSKDVEFGSDVFEGNEKLTLKGYENSTAEAYAGANSHRFSYLGIDLTELKEALDKAQAIDKNLYTDASYSVLKEAISKANLLIAQYEVNGTGSPNDVKNCLEALNDAMLGLVLKATDATETTATETTATETTEPTTEPTSNPEPVYEEFILGDADGNGIVNIKDVTYIQLYLARLLNETANPIPILAACEVDGDGEVTIKDVTQIQLWLAKFNVDFKIGELVKKEINSTNPTTPSETDPTTATEPETTVPTEPESTKPTDSDSDTITFYVPNAVGWLTDVGGKMWIYNDATKEFMNMEYNEDDDCFYLDIPTNWSELSIYRTPYEVEEADFDISKKWNEETQTGVILNEWAGLGSRRDYDCYYITADGKGYYTLYKDTKGDEEYMKTIYFDNSQTKWGTVYIYGWGKSGLNEVAKAMTHIEGTDIWSYTFVAPYIPDYGVDAFLFVNKATSKADSSSWTGAIQTGDLAIEKGKYLFVPSGTGNKIGGSWDVYNP